MLKRDEKEALTLAVLVKSRAADTSFKAKGMRLGMFETGLASPLVSEL